MHDGLRLAAIVLGLLLIGATALAQDTPQPSLESEPVPAGGEASGNDTGQQYTAPEPYSTDNLLPAIQGIESAIRDLIAEEDKVASQRQEERETADLQAQQEMALWAKFMLWASSAGVLLTGVGIVLIWRTLLHTRDAAKHAGRAVDEAKNATKAAQDAVVVAREIGEAQTRAYLYCNSAKYSIDREGVSATVELRNAGQSPASDVRIFGQATVNSVIGFPERPRVGSWIDSMQASADFQPIASNGSSFEEVVFIYEYSFAPRIEVDDVEMKADAWKNGNELMFDFTVIWKDVFGSTHSFQLNLYAVIDASPANPRKKRSPTGKLDFRMEDARHRVTLAEDEKPVD